MRFFEWDESFEGGIAEIDSQHIKLVEMINDLHDAMMVGKGADLLGSLLEQLIDYTEYHFDEEEKIFEKNGFPDLAYHKEEHRILTEQVKTFMSRHDEGLFKNAVKANRFLRDWLMNHILEKDMKAMAYIKGKTK